MKEKQFWNRILEFAQERLTRSMYDFYATPAELIKVEENTATIFLPRSEMEMENHGAGKISAGIKKKAQRARRSTPDSVALNPVSGKSRSKEAIRARLAWTAYWIVRVKFTAPPINQPTTPTENADVQTGRQVECQKQGKGAA